MTAQSLRARWLELDEIADHVQALYEKGGCNCQTAIEASEKSIAAFTAFVTARDAEAGLSRDIEDEGD